MKTAKLLLLPIAFLLFGCNQPTKAKPKKVKLTATDKVEIQQLVRNLYEWYEETLFTSTGDFAEIADTLDSVYIALDYRTHTKRLKELEQTGFFSSEFLDNYDELAKTLDKGLKDGNLEHHLGEIPGFAGGGASPWCECQDYPYEKYWEKITISDVKLEGKLVAFNWSWGGGWTYKMKAIKENRKWQIAYMHGFDAEVFFP